jgi:hypothetical protein
MQNHSQDCSFVNTVGPTDFFSTAGRKVRVTGILRINLTCSQFLYESNFDEQVAVPDVLNCTKFYFLFFF